MKLVDSNIWLYALVAPSDPSKRKKAIEICAATDICVSSQVVNLIVATALRANAEILYSEDMQDGLIVRDRLTIRNPFR